MARAIVIAVQTMFLMAAVAGATFCVTVWPVCHPDTRWILAVFGGVCALQAIGFASLIITERG